MSASSLVFRGPGFRLGQSDGVREHSVGKVTYVGRHRALKVTLAVSDIEEDILSGKQNLCMKVPTRSPNSPLISADRACRCRKRRGRREPVFDDSELRRKWAGDFGSGPGEEMAYPFCKVAVGLPKNVAASEDVARKISLSRLTLASRSVHPLSLFLCCFKLA